MRIKNWSIKIYDDVSQLPAIRNVFSGKSDAANGLSLVVSGNIYKKALTTAIADSVFVKEIVRRNDKLIVIDGADNEYSLDESSADIYTCLCLGLKPAIENCEIIFNRAKLEKTCSIINVEAYAERLYDLLTRRQITLVSLPAEVTFAGTDIDGNEIRVIVDRIKSAPNTRSIVELREKGGKIYLCCTESINGWHIEE